METFASRTVATVNGIPSIIPAGSSRVTNPHGVQKIVDPATLTAEYLQAEQLPMASGSGAPSSAPAAGSLYFDFTAFKLYAYTGSAWKSVQLA